jgi:hypothetical protein
MTFGSKSGDKIQTPNDALTNVPGQNHKEEKMSFIPIPDTVLVRLYIITGVAELKASLSLYFHRPAFDRDDMEDLITQLGTHFCPDLMSGLCDDYTMNLIEVYDLNSVDGWKASSALDISGGSSEAATPVSPALCMVVSFRGEKRGKWNAGRNFVPGLYEQEVDQVDIGSAISGPVIDAYQSLIDDPPSGWTWVIASRYHNKAPRETGVITPVVSVLQRSARFGVQKRRTYRS